MIGSHKHSAWHAGSEGRHAASAMRARAYRPLIYQLLMRRRANRIVDGRTADQAAAVRYGRLRQGWPLMYIHKSDEPMTVIAHEPARHDSCEHGEKNEHAMMAIAQRSQLVTRPPPRRTAW